MRERESEYPVQMFLFSRWLNNLNKQRLSFCFSLCVLHKYTLFFLVVLVGCLWRLFSLFERVAIMEKWYTSVQKLFYNEMRVRIRFLCKDFFFDGAHKNIWIITVHTFSVFFFRLFSTNRTNEWRKTWKKSVNFLLVFFFFFASSMCMPVKESLLLFPLIQKHNNYNSPELYIKYTHSLLTEMFLRNAW